MIEFLEYIDQQIVLALNSWNSPFFDEFMWTVSEKLTWIPLYLFLIYLGFRKLTWKKAILYVLCVVLAIGLTDFICSGIIKEMVARYRPSNHLVLTTKLHFYQFENGDFYKGGQYGFVSSHAGNFFALAWMVGQILKSHYKRLFPTLICLATLISYSRLYLGVHYLSDLIGGAIIGILVSSIILKFVYRRIEMKLA